MVKVFRPLRSRKGELSRMPKASGIVEIAYAGSVCGCSFETD